MIPSLAIQSAITVDSKLPHGSTNKYPKLLLQKCNVLKLDSYFDDILALFDDIVAHSVDDTD